MSDKNKNMKQTKHDSISELEEFVTQQAHEDAELPIGETRHQAQVVKDVLSDEVVNQKTLNRLIDEYIAGCAKYRKDLAKRNHAVLTT